MSDKVKVSGKFSGEKMKFKARKLRIVVKDLEAGLEYKVRCSAYHDDAPEEVGESTTTFRIKSRPEGGKLLFVLFVYLLRTYFFHFLHPCLLVCLLFCSLVYLFSFSLFAGLLGCFLSQFFSHNFLMFFSSFFMEKRDLVYLFSSLFAGFLACLLSQVFSHNFLIMFCSSFFMEKRDAVQ